MNNDLILRARLEEAGHYQDDIVKIYGGAGRASEKLRHKLPFVGAALQDLEMGKPRGTTLANKRKANAEKQLERNQAYAQEMKARGLKTIDAGQAPAKVNAPLPNAMDAQGNPVTTGDLLQQEKQASNPTTQPTQVGNVTAVTPQSSGATTQVATQPATTGAGATTQQPAAQQPAAQQPAAQQPAAPQQPAGQQTLSRKVQDQAQQFQSGQDMQTIGQGKGADKQTYMKNRSGLGKVADFLTFNKHKGFKMLLTE